MLRRSRRYANTFSCRSVGRAEAHSSSLTHPLEHGRRPRVTAGRATAQSRRRYG